MAASAVSSATPEYANAPGGGQAADELAELYARHAKMVLAVCRGMLRGSDEAEDAAQQTFLSAYRSLLRGGRPREPGAWLSTIARNECLLRIQRPSLVVGAPDEELTADGARDPLGATIGRADIAALWGAVSELPAQQRSALLLRELFGLSYEEVARELAVTEPAVESLIFRARRRLRVRLQTALASVTGFPLAAFRDLLLRPEIPAKLVTGAAGIALVAGGGVALHARLEPREAKAAPAATPAVGRTLAATPVAALASTLRTPRARHAGRPGPARKGSSARTFRAPSLAGPVRSRTAPTQGSSPSSARPTSTGEAQPSAPGAPGVASTGSSPASPSQTAAPGGPASPSTSSEPYSGTDDAVASAHGVNHAPLHVAAEQDPADPTDVEASAPADPVDPAAEAPARSADPPPPVADPTDGAPPDDPAPPADDPPADPAEH